LAMSNGTFGAEGTFSGSGRAEAAATAPSTTKRAKTCDRTFHSKNEQLIRFNRQVQRD
jgi:hypothetical protein